MSIEMSIEKTKDSYYEVLKTSSKGWHDNSNDYLPFVPYYLGIILAAYREFSSRVEILRNKGMNKTDRIRYVFKTHVGKIRKSDIENLCPDISRTTIEKALNEFMKEGYITKVGGGRSTAYVLSVNS